MTACCPGLFMKSYRLNIFRSFILPQDVTCIPMRPQECKEMTTLYTLLLLGKPYFNALWWYHEGTDYTCSILCENSVPFQVPDVYRTPSLKLSLGQLSSCLTINYYRLSCPLILALILALINFELIQILIAVNESFRCTRGNTTDDR